MTRVTGSAPGTAMFVADDLLATPEVAVRIVAIECALNSKRESGLR
jgi:hypothetical protein